MLPTISPPLLPPITASLGGLEILRAMMSAATAWFKQKERSWIGVYEAGMSALWQH